MNSCCKSCEKDGVDTDQKLPINYPELVVKKSTGLSKTEQKLITLGYETFFRLWSFPNPYTCQKLGKELCDLLVVFEDDIIIFSDKEISFTQTADIKVAWRRWFKRAIAESCVQLLGAKHWIERNLESVFLDAKLKQGMPIPIKITEKTRFHLIAVAHGSTQPCIEYFGGGDGGLLIDSSICGDEHTGENCQPFHIGLFSRDEKSFIHIFDDLSYSTVLRELDTIRDFIFYLSARKNLLLQKTVVATSEVDLLALHLDGLTVRNKAILQNYLKGQNEFLLVEEGQYAALTQTSKYLRWKNTLQTSYFWDELLSRTFSFLENGQSSYTNAFTIEEQSKIFHWMAAEDREFRYICSQAMLEMLVKTAADAKSTRIFASPSNKQLCYFVLVLPSTYSSSVDEYRECRRNVLQDYCMIAKMKCPQCDYVIGIAFDAIEGQYQSEDIMFLDASKWTEEEQLEAEKTYDDYRVNGCIGEYKATGKIFFSGGRMKGRDRNKPCPCGSGKKFKHCCGQ